MWIAQKGHVAPYAPGAKRTMDECQNGEGLSLTEDEGDSGGAFGVPIFRNRDWKHPCRKVPESSLFGGD